MKKSLSILCLFPLSVVGVETGESCSKIDDNTKRFECYDSVFRNTRDTQKLENNKWKVEKGKDEFSGSKYESAFIESNNTEKGRSGAVKALLILNASPSRGAQNMMFFIPKTVFKCHTNNCPVYYRLDNGDIEDIQCGELENNHPNQISCSLPYELLEKMRASQELKVKLPIYAENYNTFTFDLRDNPFLGLKGYSTNDLKILLSTKTPPKLKNEKYDRYESSYPYTADECREMFKKYQNNDFAEINLDSRSEFSYTVYNNLYASKKYCGNKKEYTDYFIYE